MDLFRIQGGARLHGEVSTDAAKNALLPILAATVLCKGEVRLLNCPRLLDVENMLHMLRSMGCQADFSANDIQIDTQSMRTDRLPEQLAKEMRSSIFMVGPVLSRLGRAVFTYPGGCEIGQRPIDLHLSGLRQLGATIIESHGMIQCEGRLRGARVHLDYPSVGATENIMMAAVLADGTTVIGNAAKEPEIVDLQRFLNACGANVRGAGSDTIQIQGVKSIHGTVYTPMPDRIVAGTYLVAAAMTSGDVMVRGAQHEHLIAVCNKLREMGVTVQEDDAGLRVLATKRLKAIKMLETRPYPGFPTDMQSQMIAALSVSVGTGVIVENVFENRFQTASELIRMGADIVTRDRVAVITGVSELNGAHVTARDLRAGAALVLAALCAKGTTTIENIRLIDRGYIHLENSLSALGAQMVRVTGAQKLVGLS